MDSEGMTNREALEKLYGGSIVAFLSSVLSPDDFHAAPGNLEELEEKFWMIKMSALMYLGEEIRDDEVYTILKKLGRRKSKEKE